MKNDRTDDFYDMAEQENEDMITLTNITLEKMRDRIKPATVFDLWFGDFKITGFDDRQVTFRTPSAIRKNIIESKYIEVLRSVLIEVLGFELDIVITSPPPGEAVINAPDAEPTVQLKDNRAVNDHAQGQGQLQAQGITSTESSSEKAPAYGIAGESSSAEEGEDSGGSENVGGIIDVNDDMYGEKIDKLLNDPNNNYLKSVLSYYTFDNFVEGSSNKFAKAACYAVAKEPTYYNPLFIYGQSGLGKTHLLHAVMNHIIHHHPSLKIVYRKCEDFMNELIEAISKAKTAEFKEKYRTADVLLIDDIQFIAGRVSTQEEFFHTFSTLYEADKQIILTSDRPPKDIKPLEERLRTRFEGGLLADVQPPSFELRTAIIKQKASQMDLNISTELVDYMAENLRQNIRQIEGALKRLKAMYQIQSTPVTKEAIDQTIAIVDPGNIPTGAMVEKIISTVSKFYGVAVEDIKSRKKLENIVNARHIAVYLIRDLTDLSLKEIGKIFGRDHTTVMASIEKIDVGTKTKNNIASEIKKLKKEIKSF